MEDKVQNNTQRDYDKDPIVIKDYGAYFQASSVILLVLILVVLFIEDFQSYRFQNLDVYSFEFIRFVISILFCTWFIYYLYKLPNRFKLTPSKFIFYNNKIKHIRYWYDGSNKKIEVDAPLQIAKISFCIMPELTFRHGREHYLSSWQLYRKSSIGVHIGKLVLYIRFLLMYLIFVLPYKIYRLTKAKVSYSLLKKNLFIHFKNRNYFLVNIYSKKELNELLEYFKSHNIPIENKTVFMPQAQNDGPFQDKNEIWTDDFNEKGEES